MKKILFAAIASVASTFAFAQVDSTAQQTPTTTDSTSQATTSNDTTSTQVAATTDTAAISEEDLKQYAMIMDSVNSM